MKRTTLLLILALIANVMFAQHRFVLQNGTSTVYSDINDAISNAANGDTLYIPGGTFNLSPTTIDKSLVWIGAGYHTDSTLATLPTIIYNSVNFNGSTDGSYFTGIHFNNTVSFGENGNDATDIIIERCLFQSGLTLRASDTDTVDINFFMRESIVLGIFYGNYTYNTSIENCMFNGRVDKFIFSDFTYCNFNGRDGSYQAVLRYMDECYFENCMFPNDWAASLGYITNCTFNTCLWHDNRTFPDYTNNGTGNIVSVNQSLIYTNVPTINSYSDQNDYHLITGSPGINASTDGTNIGIYGGPNPFKEGGLPFNPHIRSVNIPTSTTDGNLPVEISVGAQSN